MLFGADAQCLVELAAGGEDVGDLALGDGSRAHVPELLEDRELLFGADAQCLVELAAGGEDVGNSAADDCTPAPVVQGVECVSCLSIRGCGSVNPSQ